MALEQKWDRLILLLREMHGAALAYSGGVDSSLLLVAASEALNPRLAAVTAVSDTYPSNELLSAQEFARSCNVKFTILPTSELENEAYARNGPDRCYHCKKELFSKLRGLAEAEGLPVLIEGSNIDDLNDRRPGRQAALEFGVRSPLVEAELSKKEIRELARRMRLPVWDKPSLACLSSRVPFGTRITSGLLRRIETAEDRLRVQGFGQVRVRHHGDTARIELDPAQFGRLLAGDAAARIAAALKELGYTYVCLDLEGYRTGSMNEALRDEKLHLKE